MVAGCEATQLDDGQLRVQNSSISELTDGQARCDANGTTPTNFTLSNGQVTDSAGRVCEISSQDQFQCSATPDAGATTTGFSVCNGLLSFNSNSSFVACLATGSIPGYNIYTADVDRSTVTDCMAVELDVPACAVSSSSCVASTTTQTVVSTQVPAAVTVTETQTPAAVTVTATATQPAQTVSVTQPAQTVSVTQPAQTVTLPAETITHNETITQEQTIVQTVVSTQENTLTDLVTKTQENTVSVVKTATVVDTVTATQTLVNTVTAEYTVVNTVTAENTVVDTVTATPVVASTTKATSSAQATCTNITRALGSSNFPTTIEVVNSGSDVSGSSYFAYIGSGNSTIFTFNAQSSTGECSLNFDFPTTAEIEAAAGTTSYSISSSSIAVTLYELASVAAVTDTYSTKPAREAAFSATLTPGTNTTFTSFTCPTTQTSYELVATDSNTLSFFEGKTPFSNASERFTNRAIDYNLPALGLVLAFCD